MPIKICTMTCKKCAIPSLHPRCSLRSRGARRDRFLAKVPRPCPVLSSGNIPPLQADSSLPPLHSGSSLKTPTGCFINAQSSTGQFLYGRLSILPGRYRAFRAICLLSNIFPILYEKTIAFNLVNLDNSAS
jgi:hypothetical protein